MGTTDQQTAGTVRWWPFVLICTALAVVLVWIWTSFGEQRQSRVLATIAAGGLASVMALIWLALFSRLAARTRIWSVTALVFVGVVLTLSIERRGVSGDVVPLFGWRFSKTAARVVGPAKNARPEAPERVFAGDYPQFQGPARDATLVATPPVAGWADWEGTPPRELWRIEVGPGWSGFAVSGSYAVTQEQRGDSELVTCYDRLTGSLLWAHADRTRHEDPFAGTGPRATPTIVGDRVFAYGSTGRLHALELATGESLWSVDVMADAGSSPPAYGVAASPLVIGGRVVVAAGGPNGRSLIAYDSQTGELLWGAGDDPAAYSSPVEVNLAGIDQIVWLNGSNVVAHAPGDGTLLWSEVWPGGTERVSQPVTIGADRLFVSTGYGVGGKLYRIDADGGGLRSTVVWESRSLKSKFANVVFRDGYLYGLDDGILVCVDARDGQRVWKKGRYGHGQLILVDDVLLIQAEDGDVVLVAASPDGHREMGRIPGLSEKTWNHPALAGRHLLIRNDREAACYELGSALGQKRP